MVTYDDLQNDSEIADIKEDVRLECADHGTVLSVLIPRVRDGHHSSLEGLIFVEFLDSFMAISAAMVLNGRKFADKTVAVTYVSVFSNLLFPIIFLNLFSLYFLV